MFEVANSNFDPDGNEGNEWNGIVVRKNITDANTGWSLSENDKGFNSPTTDELAY